LLRLPPIILPAAIRAGLCLVTHAHIQLKRRPALPVSAGAKVVIPSRDWRRNYHPIAQSPNFTRRRRSKRLGPARKER
jgi:hypothetical protein